MSQIAQLSEAEIEERFHIAGARPVAFMLAGFAKENDQFSVMFQAGQEMFLTTLLAVKPEKGLFIFDCSGSAETNRKLLASEKNVFVGRPGDIRVQFTTGAVSELIYAGSKAFSVALPKFLVRLQRRDFFRIATPRAKPLQFFGRLPEGISLQLSLHDISVAGAGLTAASLPDGLASGQVLENCHFSLPGDDRDLFFDATLNHMSEHEARSGVRHWRLGLAFKKLPVNDENRIQRYIGRLERERHELA
ncbi:MAG: flagellar brake protein [Azonexus sp.]|jgi:c-di-GMP-binding flagellar brake protein YcgR|nr:flagellar brake protein [Azonexus sp.]